MLCYSVYDFFLQILSIQKFHLAPKMQQRASTMIIHIGHMM